ncbi:MAG: energy-coupling factor transporter ATPase [Clostridia bacterium]|nr:energy-coupling factor transporter ATPase [Clostridia bacterium]
MSDRIIEIKDVWFSYDGDNEGEKLPPVLKGVTLDVERGEFLAILGRNGSGKSTLTRICNAMALPDKGSVHVDGLDTADPSLEYEIRAKIGVVMQNPDNQIVASIVEEDVAFGPENLGVDPAEIRVRVDDALKRVGMYEYRNHEPHKLSGGQKQRVAIAGVVAMRTECIVLDEPTAMLDPAGRKEVMNTILELNKEFGITVVLITHYMNEAVLADRVAVMDEGRIVACASPAEVFSDREALRSVGLDTTQTAMLAALLKKKGIELKGLPLTPDAFVSAFLQYIGEHS